MRQSGKRNRKEEQNGMEKTYSLSKEKKVCRPGSKMKCNALECLLKIQAQKGVANEKVPSINSMGKNKDSDVKAIGVLINEDCRSA
jgi:hypothetical protein